LRNESEKGEGETEKGRREYKWRVGEFECEVKR
jgi:hypothetical protein